MLVTVSQTDIDRLPPNRLGVGEQAVITYARFNPGCVAGLDDRQARLLADQREVDRSTAYFHVTQRRRGRFNFVMWDAPGGTLAPYAEESLVRNGVTVQLGGHPPLVCAAFDVPWIPYTTRIQARLDTNGMLEPFSWNDSAAVAAAVRAAVTDHQDARRHGAFVWSLGDEVDTRGSDLTPGCARAYRDYLREQYGSLDSLNASWGTRFITWQQVGLADSTRGGGTARARSLGVRRFGDVDGNGLVQAYDASRVLAHVLSPFLSPRDSLAANVDSLAPDGGITPYDAALILQRRVRMRRCFPVQCSASRNQPWWEPAAKPMLACSCLGLSTQGNRLALRMEDRRGFVSGSIHLGGIHGRAHLPEDLKGFLVASRQDANGLQVVLAGSAPAYGPGEVIVVRLDQPLTRPPRITGSLDDGAIRFTEADAASSIPDPVLGLLSNYPNPFNPTTQVEYALTTESHVVLTVLDILGRPVRTLECGRRSWGYHVIGWDGRDEQGTAVATGVYFCRLQAGSRQWIRPMLLLR